MPEPGMVQLDPAQKQAPAKELFSLQQMVLQAKVEVNLLLEKSKSVAETDKGKLENLQVLSSFSATAKPGHEKETYEIYRQAVCRANELLIGEGSNVGLRLEEASPGKLIIVCGIYEEREPKAAQEKKKVEPLALNETEWLEMRAKIDRVVEAKHGEKKFEELSTVEKLTAVWLAIAPELPDGSKSEFTYKTSGNPADYAPQTASETLARKSGDCDDFSALFTACVKRLDDAGLLKVEGTQLALMEYYDPKEKAVKAHANVLQIILKDETPEKKAVFVDFTFNPKCLDLEMVPKDADLKKMMLEHLNEHRENADKIRPDCFQLLVYGGGAEKKYSGVESYFHERKDAERLIFLKEAGLLKGDADEIFTNNKSDDASLHEKAIQKYNAANDMLNLAISELENAVRLGRESGGYYGDALFRLAAIYETKKDNLIVKASAMEKIAGQKPLGSDAAEKMNAAAKKVEADGDAARVKSNDLYAEGFGMNGLGAVAISLGAYHLSRMRKYHEAEKAAVDAITSAPFKIDGYDALKRVLFDERKYAEAIDTFRKYDESLSNINSGKTGDIFGLRETIGGYIKEAENELTKKP